MGLMHKNHTCSSESVIFLPQEEIKYLRTNSDLCHLQHKLIGFYNLVEKCLLRGTDWVFK